MVGTNLVKMVADIWKKTAETGPLGTAADIVDLGVALSEADRTMRYGESPELVRDIGRTLATLHDENASEQARAAARERASRYIAAGIVLEATLSMGRVGRLGPGFSAEVRLGLARNCGRSESVA
jgi:hypothetical protein